MKGDNTYRDPPRAGQRLLEFICPNELREEIKGDLSEIHNRDQNKYPLWIAHIKYLLNVLGTFRLRCSNHIHEHHHYYEKSHFPMITNYLKIAFRNLKNQFTYSFLNILGLAIGLTCATFIYLYVQHELKYDQFHQFADRIYRADFNIEIEGNERTIAVAPTALLPTLKSELPEVVSGVRIFNSPFASIVRYDDKVFREDNLFYADSTFLGIFSFELSYGNPENALNQPNSIIVTQETAKKFFGQENPIGKTLVVNNRNEYTVTGIFEKIPSQSHITFDFVASLASLGSFATTERWSNASFPTYLLLKEPSDGAVVQSKLPAVIDKAMGDAERKPSYKLIALTDIHLHSDVENEYKPQSDISYIYIFGAVGILILGIASINYMNLATARSARRSREVGVRKVLGAYRSQLKLQFIGESIFNTLVAMVITLFLLQLLLPVFNDLTGIEFFPGELFSLQIMVFFIITSIIISFVSGLYPSFVLSRFEPARVLKGTIQSTGQGKKLRNSLVVIQFTISAALIMSTIGIHQQLTYFQNKSLGYDTENVFSVTAYPEVEDRFQTLRSQFLQHPEVVSMSMASENPTQIRSGYNIEIEGVDTDENDHIVGLRAYPNLVQTLGLEMLAGRNFMESDLEGVKPSAYEDRRYAFIMNESALSTFNLSVDEALGRRVNLNGRIGTVVGIVKNFHFASLHSEIGPLIMFVENSYNKILTRIQSSNTRQIIQELSAQWAEIFPFYPFEYEFMDQEYSQLYKFENRISEIFNVFAIIAVIVACLGLFGLASYMAVQRTKEISIRKVLGATISGLVILVTRDIVKLILLSAAIGLPLAWFALNFWLQNFAYRIAIGWEIIVVSVVTVFLIALFTVSYQAIKAARVNPVDNLYRE